MRTEKRAGAGGTQTFLPSFIFPEQKSKERYYYTRGGVMPPRAVRAEPRLFA